MPKGTPRSVQEPLITATVQALIAANNVSALVTGVFNNVPQGQPRPYLVVENFTAIPWHTMGEHGSECTLQLRAVSDAFGDQEAARILDAAIGDLSYTHPTVLDYRNPAQSTFVTVSYKRDHEVTYHEELVGGVRVRTHLAIMRVLIAQPS